MRPRFRLRQDREGVRRRGHQRNPDTRLGVPHRDDARLDESLKSGALCRIVQAVIHRDLWSTAGPAGDAGIDRYPAVGVGNPSEDHIIRVLRTGRGVGELQLLAGATVRGRGDHGRVWFPPPGPDGAGPLRGLL